MKPVAIFRHSPTEGPGYFATYLDERNIPWVLVKIDEGDPVPTRCSSYAAMTFMGGPMSVNDPLPWIEPVLALIRDAVSADIPVLGHCLGGQLMSKALGGVVGRNPVKEIGWGEVDVARTDAGRAWFGEFERFNSFHWHGDTFTTPPGAENIASSAYCTNQAFAMGKHLGMQCHVEMTPALVRAWCQDWHKEVTALSGRMPSVQSPEKMQEALEARVAKLNAVARRIYDRWVAGIEAN